MAAKRRKKGEVGGRVLLVLGTASLVFFAAVLFRLGAQAAGNSLGWLWGGGEAVNDGAINGNESGLGWMSMSGTTYGVTIPETDGPLSGYAWSENVGWIDFAPAGPYPTAPNYSARRTGNSLEGWARVTSIANAGANAGGWLGWVKLSGTAQNGTSYGVSVGAEGTLGGYAWSDELGAIDFSKATFSPQHKLSVSAGNGTVTSNPAGINCNSGVGVCEYYFNKGTAVSLSQTPDLLYDFDGWGGSCTGTGACNVTMDADKTVSASYDYRCNACPSADEMCSGSSCDPGCGLPLVQGTKSCIKTGTYKEVAP